MDEIQDPIHVLITGAAGQIGYVLAFRIANGDAFGNRHIVLHLLDVTNCLRCLEAVVMELNDCTFPLLDGAFGTDNVEEAFTGIDYAFLVGSFPKKPSLSQKVYMSNNAVIFREHGVALSKFAKKTVKVLVVGNPANTNCLVCSRFAEGIPPENFTAMTRLDHNRAVNALAEHLKSHPKDIHNVVVWGNRSSTQVADVSHAIAFDPPQKVADLLEPEFVSTLFDDALTKHAIQVQRMRGASTSASAAHAAVCQMRDWVAGTPAGFFTSMAVVVPSSAPYGIKPGLVFSLPVRCAEGSFEIVADLDLDEAVRAKIKRNEEELTSEASFVSEALRQQLLP